MSEKEPILKAESSLTERYQTTIPEVVRKALGLSKGDKLEFLFDDTGAVRIAKREPQEIEHTDPALPAFLRLLENDIESNPQNLKEVSTPFWGLIEKLSSDVEVDLDQRLEFGLDELIPGDKPDRA
ncbi:MAG: type II toxin-antitoxin system PrlF family antitoxin [Rhodoluna sp.]